MKALDVSLLSAMIVDLDIRLASHGDARTLSVLADANLGPGYFDLPEAGRTAVALDQGVIVGFCYARAIKEDDPLWIDYWRWFAASRQTPCADKHAVARGVVVLAYIDKHRLNDDAKRQLGSPKPLNRASHATR